MAAADARRRRALMAVRAVIAAVPTKALVALGATVLVLLGLLGTAGWQLFRAHQLIGAGEAALAQCQEDNRHQTRQLRSVRDELAAMVARMALEREAVSAQLLASEQRDRRRDREIAAERQARDEIYTEVAECEAWRRQQPCAEIAERMIRRREALISRWQDETP